MMTSHTFAFVLKEILKRELKQTHLKKKLLVCSSQFARYCCKKGKAMSVTLRNCELYYLWFNLFFLSLNFCTQVRIFIRKHVLPEKSMMVPTCQPVFPKKK